MTFYSKKDLWLILIVALAVAVPACTGLYMILTNSASKGWQYIWTAVMAGGVVLLCTYPLYYEVTHSTLNVRSGFFRWEIPLNGISEVEPTRNLSSSPAWSLDRLRINYRDGSAEKSLLISPDRKDDFLRELSARDPQLRPINGRLIRVPN